MHRRNRNNWKYIALLAHLDSYKPLPEDIEEYYTEEEVKGIITKKGITEDCEELHRALNKARTIYGCVAKEIGQDTTDFYVKLALAKLKHHKLNK